MTDMDDDSLIARLEKAETEAARLRLQIAHGPCAKVGHRWKSIGGCNCGCEFDGGEGYCSVPVHVCEKCGDCDYGENEEANEKRATCAEMRSHD